MGLSYFHEKNFLGIPSLNDVGRDPELCALHLFNRPEIYLVLDIDDLCPLSPLVRLAMEAEDECV